MAVNMARGGRRSRETRGERGGDPGRDKERMEREVRQTIFSMTQSAL